MLDIFLLFFLQSETCEVILPSLDFTCTAGTLGGRFTTLEGLLSNMKDHVRKRLWFFFFLKYVEELAYEIFGYRKCALFVSTTLREDQNLR